MPMSRDTGRIVTLSLLSVFLWIVASDRHLAPSETLTGKLFYNCYSCDETKGECKLELVHETEEIGSPCAALGLGTSCAQACKCPSGTWPCEQNACLAAFSDVKNWISYQPNLAEGYVGSVYDGERYLYFVPYKNDSGPQGVVWRYDTRAALNSQPSWGSFDPSANGLGTTARGFAGGAFDGRYVYFAPNENAAGPSGSVMRYDTTKNMAAVSSWELFDPSGNGSSPSARGYNGAIFDGKYVYFVPDFNMAGAHNDVMRYDVSKPFKDATSWEVFNPKPGASAKKGYAGAVYDGRYVYFIPKGSDYGTSVAQGGSALAAQAIGKPVGSSAMHGDVLRYDTRASFSATSSWTTFDPSANGVGSNARGYNGGVFDGTYIYFAPYINSGGAHGEVLRYNTKQSFTSASSWTTFNVSTGGVDAGAKGYIGAAFDGQFVYFAPYYDGSAYHGKVLRYNTKEPYTNKLSWTAFNIATAQNSSSGGTGAKRYQAFTATANINWMDAEASCVSKGGHLASITSAAENTAAIAAAGTRTSVWIGLNDRATEGQYVWTSGAAFSYNDWEMGQPDGLGIDYQLSANDCVFINHTGPGKWHDVGCNDPAFQTPNYLCELPDSSSSSAAAASSLGTGGRFGITETGNFTLNPDGSITFPNGGGSATVQYNCSAQIDVPPGWLTNGIRCGLTNGAGTQLLSGDAIYRNVGGFTIQSSTQQTFNFTCDYTLYNSISSYPHNVCSISIPVKINTSTCTRPPECIGNDLDKLWNPITCSCI